MTAHDIPRLFACADAMADAARTAILPYFRAAHGLENKAEHGFDPVTEADRASEQAMRAIVAAHFPEHGVLGEEFGDTPGKSGYQWILDPIDGTRAFISGLPLWGVLIGLSYEGAPILGVMDQPYLDERYSGWAFGEAAGAYATTRGERKPLKTRMRAGLSEATLSTTDGSLLRNAEGEAFNAVRAQAKLTRYGYDCYAYAMTASGHMDCVIESGLKSYDIAALIPILAAAGGGVCNWRGGDASKGGQVLAYGDPRVRDEALALLERAAS
ncbi:histidinol-phosphatase [Terricaulis sp.]|uniref:histidinol-phosphatase n=1 Tax=Terricaulis sp. TaxID=2768686 RepID=UPI003784AA94